MANLQNTLDALQPYVIGIRYLDGGGAVVVDAVFKDDWILPESEVIKKVKGNDELNYYMLFSDNEGVGIDELLEFVSVTIKANVEREKKHELLKDKINELKQIFKKYTLTNLKRLKFTFGDEELAGDIHELDLDSEITGINQPTEKIALSAQTFVTPNVPTMEQVIDESNLSEEDKEILEEERRAANYMKIKEQQKLNGSINKIASKVELPPKKRVEEQMILEPDCTCGPEEACSKCIGTKDL